MREPRTFEDRRPHESGVAQRFPPQSMTPRAMTTRIRFSALPGWFGGVLGRGRRAPEKNQG